MAEKALLTGAVLSFILPDLSESCVCLIEDKQGAIAFAENLLSAARTNDMDTRFHFAREDYYTQFVASGEQHAGGFVKFLATTLFF